ncbi:hypothetical protein N7470_005646 [Penicillium chermesinum]|nr:hypothetical protein N7470_005646 [Penicillium chermesinum]
MPESEHEPVIPAQLSFLAIYNPTLGPTDETLEDQIVFYTSRSGYIQRTEGSSNEEEGASPPADGKNERLWQIGLAQGMVSFASTFSSKPLEYVETEKSRIVLFELEKDWWIVAVTQNIDLTRLLAEARQPSSTDKSNGPSYHYSSREMGPPHLLTQQLRRAYSIFLLHHDYSLNDLYTRVGRSAFCLFMERFWEKFAWNWELLLSGNPIVEIYNGIKLAAGGELGIGVGEEEWGSGEREVLEDFVSRTEGLQDLVVSRFGEPHSHNSDSPPLTDSKGEAWLGMDADPQSADGVVFSGVHTISRRSVARISHWMEWIYRYGDAAYGIGRDPSSMRRRKPRRHRGKHLHGGTSSHGERSSTPEQTHLPGIPRPLITATSQSQVEVPENSGASSPANSSQKNEASAFGTDTMMKVLTLGYGSAWSFPSKIASPLSTESSTPSPKSSANAVQTSDPPLEPKPKPMGRFILGARDDLDTLDDFEEESAVLVSDTNTKTRIVHRPLHLHLRGGENVDSRQKLHAVIYVYRPFMFTFLFDSESAALSSPALYSSIHHQLGPLQKPLVSSTSTTAATSRIASSNNSELNKRFAPRDQSVYDLVYDPSNLTIRTSIPNIPNLGTPFQPLETSHSPRTSSSTPNQPSKQWTRVESLTIHQHLLTTYIDTRCRPQEIERTCKMSRGWWVLWVRMPSSPSDSTPRALSTTSSSVALSTMADDQQDPSPKSRLESCAEPHEAFIIRMASDHASQAGHARMSSGARFFRDLGGASSTNTVGGRAENTPSKLVEGLGIDARRYVEGLLRLNR